MNKNKGTTNHAAVIAKVKVIVEAPQAQGGEEVEGGMGIPDVRLPAEEEKVSSFRSPGSRLLSVSVCASVWVAGKEVKNTRYFLWILDAK